MINAPTIEVANVSMADTLVLMIIALVVFGPRKLPQIGKQIGKLMYEFRKASNDFKFQMEEELRASEEADRRKKEEEERQKRLAANPPAQIEASTAASTEASAATDTSYPYSATYGEIAEAQEKAAAEQPTTEPAVEPTIQPTIQAPSTGETVPAQRPGSGYSEPAREAAAAPAGSTDNHEPSTESYASQREDQEQITVEKVIDAKDSAAEEADKTIEPAAHNG